MKRTIITALATLAFAGASFAGVTSSGKEAKQYKEVVEPTCFNDQELQLDVFGSYTFFNDGTGDEGWGGGIGLNYYFVRYVGIGVDGNIADGDVNGLWNFSGSLLLRYPIDSACLAPYILAGGGVAVDGSPSGTVHAGGGLEYRVVPHKLGIYAEGRYTWDNDHDDAANVRLGVRFVF